MNINIKNSKFINPRCPVGLTFADNTYNKRLFSVDTSICFVYVRQSQNCSETADFNDKKSNLLLWYFRSAFAKAQLP